MTERDDSALCAEADPAIVEEPPAPVDEELPDGLAAGAAGAEGLPVPPHGGCRTGLHGWAGAHLHGAVRPRRRAAGRGRPPGRWC